MEIDTKVEGNLDSTVRKRELTTDGNDEPGLKRAKFEGGDEEAIAEQQKVYMPKDLPEEIVGKPDGGGKFNEPPYTFLPDDHPQMVAVK